MTDFIAGTHGDFCECDACVFGFDITDTDQGDDFPDVDEPEWPEDEPQDQFRDDVEADADVLRSAGWGTDEDYGYDGGDDGTW